MPHATQWLIRPVAIVVVFSMPGALRAQSRATEAPAVVKANAAKLLKKALAEDLASMDPLEAEETRTERTLLGDVTCKVRARAVFRDPKTRLKVEVPTLTRTGEHTVRGIAKVSCPARGEVEGWVPSAIGEVVVRTGFTANAEMEVECEFTVNLKGQVVEVQARVRGLKSRVRDVKFREEVLDVLSGPAEQAANGWLDKNRDILKDKANEALVKASKEGKLRTSLRELAVGG